MKIIGICGSPKKTDSATELCLAKAMEAATEKGLSGQVIRLSEHSIQPCTACGLCRKELACSLTDGFSQTLLPLMADSDIKGFIFASPVYFGGVSAQMKAFIDRCIVFRRNGFVFENRIAGVLTVGGSRNGGQELAAMDLIKSALIQGMIVVPDAPKSTHFGGMAWSGGENGIAGDKAGLESCRNLGRKVAEIALRVHAPLLSGHCTPHRQN